MTITITIAKIVVGFDELVELMAVGDGELVVLVDEELELL